MDKMQLKHLANGIHQCLRLRRVDAALSTWQWRLVRAEQCQNWAFAGILHLGNYGHFVIVWNRMTKDKQIEFRAALASRKCSCETFDRCHSVAHLLKQQLTCHQKCGLV